MSVFHDRYKLIEIGGNLTKGIARNEWIFLAPRDFELEKKNIFNESRELNHE